MISPGKQQELCPKVVAMVLDLHFGSGSGSKLNRYQIGGHGFQ